MATPITTTGREVHRAGGRQVGKTRTMEEWEASAIVWAWRRKFDGLCVRAIHAPLVRPLLSERLLYGGPRVAGRFPDRAEQVMATARPGARLAVQRMRLAQAQAELERQERIAVLTGGPPVDAPAIDARYDGFVLPDWAPAVQRHEQLLAGGPLDGR